MTTTKFDGLGIGNAIVDVLARTDDDFLVRHQMPKGSMQLIDEARAGAIYDAMGPAVEISGGSAANTIVGVASFSGRAHYVGKVRNDQLGEVFAHDLRSVGVRYTTAMATSGPATGRCLIVVTPDAQRTMSTYLGASTLLNPNDVDPGVIKRGRILYLEGYLFDPPAAQEAFRVAAEAAHAAGRKVALTRCERGSVVVGGDEIYVVDAHPVDAVVDTTGAGDLYAAGFLFGLSRGHDHVTAARLGALAAAEVIQHLGARPEKSLKALAQ